MSFSSPLLVAILLALGAALCWGGGDWMGGRASKTRSTTQVLMSTQIVSMVVLVVLLAGVRLSNTTLLGDTSFLLSPGDTFFAAIAGLAHVVGVAGIYWALSRGPAAVVAPITAVLAASLPVTLGLLRLGIPGPLLSAGLAGAVVASVLLAGPGRGHTSSKVLLASGISGLGFAVQPAALGIVEAPGIPVVFVSELVSLLLLAGWLLWKRIRVGGYTPLLVACGSTRVIGTVLFTLAAGYDLRIAAAVSSLYPAMTILLARFADHQRLMLVQFFGAALALVALVALALGV